MALLARTCPAAKLIVLVDGVDDVEVEPLRAHRFKQRPGAEIR